MSAHYCRTHSDEAQIAGDPERLMQDHTQALGEATREVQNRDTLTIAAGVNPTDVMGRMKPGLGNVPPGPLYAEARAFDAGAAKYGAFNWRGIPIKASVYHDACKRHLDQWFHGNDHAADSGVHHLAHAVACLLILLYAEQQQSLKDNRPPRNIPLDDILASMGAPKGATA